MRKQLWKRLEDKIKNIYKRIMMMYPNRFVQIGYEMVGIKRTYRIKEDIAMDHNAEKNFSI